MQRLNDANRDLQASKQEGPKKTEGQNWYEPTLLAGSHGNPQPFSKAKRFPSLQSNGIQRKYQWIGLRENLQETKDFPIKYGAFL